MVKLLTWRLASPRANLVRELHSSSLAIALLFLADLLGFCTSVQLLETVSLVRLTICFRTLDADPSNPLFDLGN